MKNKDWREQFNEKFVKQGIPIGIAKYEAKDGLDITPSKIISFIDSLLKSKQEEIEREMKKMKKIKTTGFLNVIWGEKLKSKIPAMSDTDVSYNKAIDDLKPIISNLLK